MNHYVTNTHSIEIFHTVHVVNIIFSITIVITIVQDYRDIDS